MLGNEFVAKETPEAPASPAVHDQHSVQCCSQGKPDPELAVPPQQTAGRLSEPGDGANAATNKTNAASPTAFHDRISESQLDRVLRTRTG